MTSPSAHPHALLTKRQAHERQIAEREERIGDISAKHSIKGYDHTPLSKQEVAEFSEKLRDLRKRLISEYDKLQVHLSLLVQVRTMADPA